jgi:hypothetical protein
MGLGRIPPVSLCVLTLALAGCSAGPTVPTHNPIGNSRYSGSVHGGQQAIVGAAIQLYTVGTTADGSAATPLLTSTVTSDATGSFTITGLYSCTNATQVYIVATGGNPGLSTANPDIALMAALGPCSALTSSTFININELTTAAAVFALAPYMTSATAIGSSSSDATALAAAFTLANQLVDTTTGASPGANLPSGFTVPATQLNTLADILSACINSTGGAAGDGSLCGDLFSLTTITPNPAPTNTLAAMLNLANNPTLNTSALYALTPPTPPFQPTLASAPPYFSPGLTPTSPSYSGFNVLPASLALPPEPIGTTSPPLNIFLSANSPVDITSLRILGPNAADFALSDSCSNQNFDGLCALTVTARPSAIGTGTAYLEVQSTDPYSPQFVALTETGTSAADPSITLTPSLTWNVANTLQDLTLTNSSSAPLSIQSVTIQGGPSGFLGILTGPFFSIAQNTCGSTLAAGAHCTLSVVATLQQPSTSLDYTVVGAVTVADNASNGFQSAALTSNNLFSINNLSNGIVTFPATAVGSSSNEGPYLYTRTTTTSAPAIDLALSGAEPGDFGVSTTDAQMTPSGSSCPGPYGEGQFCDITFTFTPTAAGTRSARVAVNPSGTGVTGQYILLSGTATNP